MLGKQSAFTPQLRPRSGLWGTWSSCAPGLSSTSAYDGVRGVHHQRGADPLRPVGTPNTTSRFTRAKCGPTWKTASTSDQGPQVAIIQDGHWGVTVRNDVGMVPTKCSRSTASWGWRWSPTRGKTIPTLWAFLITYQYPDPTRFKFV